MLYSHSFRLPYDERLTVESVSGPFLFNVQKHKYHQENQRSLLDNTKELGVWIKAEKTEYIFMYHHHSSIKL
jgi:hypothetical protein